MKGRCFTISEFGLKIKNIEASTLFEYNNGVREHYEYKEAMFANSLFGDYLIEHGLKIQKQESTRDLICLEFNYGSRSYSQELTHLYKTAATARREYRIAKVRSDKYSIENAYQKCRKISDLLKKAYQNKARYKPKTKEEIRTVFYNNGVSVDYVSRNKNGEIKKVDSIHYTMLYRSTGKAKKGACMFIRDSLYKKAINFLYMGIKLPKENPMIVEISAYAPLVSSGIVGKVRIDPKNILILKDIDRYFKTNVVSIETDENRHCFARTIAGYELKNTLFDGQALIDSSIFPSWGNGYILLRHHFCKMAAFHTRIQSFFRDYFGDNYEYATVTDMFGVKHFVKDIRLITTDNAMKWIKFGVSYDDWCKKVYENDAMFGIVKTAHESKLGSYQKMSYQMVNSLDVTIMERVVKESVNYVHKLKSDNSAFLCYLRNNSNFSNDYQVLAALCEQNPDFAYSSYFRSRKKSIINAYVLGLKSGDLIQNAENLTIVGSPYAMLLYGASGKEGIVDEDDTFCQEPGTIQCYTERFHTGEYLAFFRSPFNSKNNLTYLHNIYNDKFEKYFRFGKQIIAVNLIGTDFQDRNNGSDQDSDFGYTTNQPDIVAHASMCYRCYPTIVNNIPKEQNTYHNTMDDYASIDSGLAKSQLDIGESSNLAQIAQTYACNDKDIKYLNYVCILSVLAQVAIDSSKRRFNIDLSSEIKRIKDDLDIKRKKYPAFWTMIKKDFNKNNINRNLTCPMNYLSSLELNRCRNERATLPMSHFFQKFESDTNRIKNKRMEELIQKYSIKLLNYNASAEDRETRNEEYLLLRSDFHDLIRDISKVYMSKQYLGLMSWLIDRAFLITPNVKRNNATIKTTIDKNKSLLLKTLYDINPQALLQCFSKNAPNS